MKKFALAATASALALASWLAVAQADETTSAQAFFSLSFGGEQRTSLLDDARLGLQFSRETQIDDMGVRTLTPEYQTKTFNFVDVQFAGDGEAKALSLMGTPIGLSDEYRLNANDDDDMRQFYIWGGAAVGITLIACLAADCFNEDDDEISVTNAEVPAPSKE